MNSPSNTHIRIVDMIFLDDLFEMSSGYVLNFNDRAFTIFFAQELNIDINDPVYAVNGTSKAKRLRCFLRLIDKPLIIRTLQALWEYREAVRLQKQNPESIENAHGRLLSLINKLSGITAPSSSNHQAPIASDKPKTIALKSDLLALANLQPQARGYAFEVFLKKMFDLYGLTAREPFRLYGEQIDGSFQLEGETYLIEAKWKALPIGVADLHTFHGKLEQKAAWTRGLFVSESGFTEEGLVAFGRAKRVICMDGLDIYESLERQLPLNHVLITKARHAAETGLPFARVRDLF
jgi:Restriction endonuclease